MNRNAFSTLLFFHLLLFSGHRFLYAQNDNGRGRHKQLYAVPVPGDVTIDGNLDDWDLSAQIEMFVVQATRATQNAKLAVMYDRQALYLSGDVCDPSPMKNRHDPQSDPELGWDADSCQFRLTLDPKVGYPVSESVFTYKQDKSLKDTRNDIVHLQMWYFTDRRQPALLVQHGMTYRSANLAWGKHGLAPEDAYVAKYRKHKDKTGYTFEYRIPWQTLGAQQPLRGGDIVAGTTQFTWSRPDGIKSAGHSAWAFDLLGKPGFPFQTSECWGKLIFAETGNVDRALVEQGVPPERPLPLTFQYAVPEDSEVTVQLVNNQNEVVRIITPQQQRMGGLNTERWDGLDNNGQLLPAGTYTWQGVYSEPIHAKFRFSVHNSGNPPYPTDDNKGSWGADHGPPQTVCALPDGMVLAWSVCEYGWGIIRTDLEGRKQWGCKMNAEYLAVDEQHIYFAGGGGFHVAPGQVRILDLKDSRTTSLDNGVAHFGPPPGSTEKDHHIFGLACAAGKLYVAYQKRNLIAVYSTQDGTLKHTWNVTAPGRLAIDRNGVLKVISAGHMVSVEDGRVTPFVQDHLDAPQAVAIAKDGTVYVANRGTLQAVSVFSADGNYLKQIGQAGGRPAKGRFERQGMYEAGGIALDVKGRLWVAETTDYPKRISVWNTQTGRNELEFFGGSCYFGYGHIDPARPDEILAHNVLWHIDWDTYQTRPITTVWRQTHPDMMPAPGSSGYAEVSKIMTAANGRQYMWGAKHPRLSILLRRAQDVFLPFAALVNVDDRQGKHHRPTHLACVDNDSKQYPQATYFWQDGNNDQKVQPDEMARLDIRHFNAKVAWINPDLSVQLTDGRILHPTEIESNGRPRYDITQLKPTFLHGHALYPSRGYLMPGCNGEVYTLAGGNLVGWTCQGQPKFAYRNVPAWRDALNLPPVKAGRLQGSTGNMGIAGDFFAHQNYFAYNHLFRTDGMYLGGVLNESGTAGRGAYEGQPEGQNGSFVKLSIKDQKRYFIVHGGADTRVWEVLNLDTIKDLTGGTYEHTPDMVAVAEKALADYQLALAGGKDLTIVRGAAALDSAPAAVKSLEDGRSFEVRTAYDADKLYVSYKVTTNVPLENSIAEDHILFRGGNLLDIQLAADPGADPNRSKPAPGDMRILVTRTNGKTRALLFKPKITGFNGTPTVLKSPTGTESFDSIESLKGLGLAYQKTDQGFNALLTIPLKELGLSLKPKDKIRMDAGYIFGNKGGTRTAKRAYINNNSFSANVTDDIPHESRLEPAEWGEALVE